MSDATPPKTPPLGTPPLRTAPLEAAPSTTRPLQDTLLDIGLAPLGTAGGEVVHARTYRHPHLGDRPVIRLIGETTAPGEDRVMAFFGFTDPDVSRPLTVGRGRGLGYPAWALVNDPGNAKVALAAVTGMQRAARTALARPGAAEDAYAELAAGLPHTHLPSFWEQAGRAFIAAGHGGRAAVMFGRAREAERAYALPVDEPARRAVFLEYAFAGALPVKSIAAYVGELSARHEPRRAYDELFDLAVRRTFGGLPPWTDLPKQLRGLAGAAGLDLAAEDERLISALLTAPSVRGATAGFWKSYRAALAVQPHEMLLEVFPTADGVAEWWLELLDEVGALDGVSAAWLTKLVAHLGRGWRNARASEVLLALVPRVAARLAAEGEPVRLAAGTGWRAGRIDPDLLDTCLAAGVPVADPAPGAAIWLYSWLDDRRTGLSAVAADPRYAALLARAVADFPGHTRRVEELVDVPVLRALVRDWLLATAAAARDGGLAGAAAALGRLEHGIDGAVLDELDGVREAVEAIDPAVQLRRTLRAGVFDELGWDAFDAAVEAVGGEEPGISVSWPVLTVYSYAKAVAVGPGGRVAEHVLRVPAEAENVKVLYAGGCFRVSWGETGGGTRFYWSSAPGEVSASRQWESWDPGRAGLGYAFLTPSGGRITGMRALHAGDGRAELADTGHLLWDGRTFWTRPDRWGQELRELDPGTGQLGPAALPAFLADAPLADGERWVLGGCSLAPLPEGVRRTPLGGSDGMAGFRVSERDGRYAFQSIDGRAGQVTLDAVPWGLLDLPGRAEPLVVAGDRQVSAVEADGTRHWTVNVGEDRRSQSADGTPMVPPPAFWHFLEPRDPAGSAVLRELSEEAARALMDGGEPAIADARLRRGVAGLVRQAGDLVRRRDELLAKGRAVADVRLELDEDELTEALGGLVTGQGRLEPGTGRQIAIAAGFLSGELDAEAAAAGLPNSFLNWTQLVGRLGGVAVRAVSAATPPPRRQALLLLLERWAGSRLAEPGLRRGVVRIDRPTARVDEHGAFLALKLAPDWPGIYDAYVRAFVEHGAAPRAGEILDVDEPPAGWADRDRLAALVKGLRERGHADWDDAAAELLAERTGLAKAAASLLLAGLPGHDDRGRDFLGAEVRELLGLTAAEADAARAELSRLSAKERRDLLDAAMTDDPWDQRALAASLAAAWNARYGRRVPVPEETVAAIAKLSPRLPAGRLASVLAAPDTAPELAPDTAPEPAADADGRRTGGPGGERIGLALDALVEDLATALPWAYANLPGGHPIRAGLAAVFDLVRRRLADPGLLLESTDKESAAFWDREQRLVDAVDLLRSDGYGEMAARAGLLGDGRWEADPRVSAPGLVSAVGAALGVGEDAAVLYLQLLALLEPTDRNVRTWNDWTPARHKTAAAVLVEKGLVLAAKRERAGRGVFLPGGWTAAKAPNLPLETWKQAMYPLTLRRHLPGRSLPGLFAEAWRRVVAGEGPTGQA